MSKIPARYESSTFEQVPEKIRKLFTAMKDSRKGIYITGGVGTGKTHVAYGLLKQWEESTAPADFWNVSELLQEIKDDYDRDAYSKTHTFDRLMESRRLLFLDDIGSEKTTEFVQERFYLLINRRYNEMLPTIFTSNLSIGQLAEKVGDRIASRIVEMCDVVPLSGDDKRLKK